MFVVSLIVTVCVAEYYDAYFVVILPERILKFTHIQVIPPLKKASKLKERDVQGDDALSSDLHAAYL